MLEFMSLDTQSKGKLVDMLSNYQYTQCLRVECLHFQSRNCSQKLNFHGKHTYLNTAIALCKHIY